MGTRQQLCQVTAPDPKVLFSNGYSLQEVKHLSRARRPDVEDRGGPVRAGQPSPLPHPHRKGVLTSRCLWLMA